MQIATTYFNLTGDSHFRRMCSVFAYSVRMWDLPLHIIDLGTIARSKRSHRSDNLLKMYGWVMYLNEQPNNAVVLFMDNDMFMTGCPRHLEKLDIDFAITWRTKHQRPNTGFVLCRNTPEVRQFFSRWFDNQKMLVANRPLADEMYKRHHGLNQAALHLTQEAHGYPKKTKILPCAKYNSCKEDWAAPLPTDNRVSVHLLHEELRFVAVYGKRPDIRTNRRRKQRFLDLAKQWQDLESEAKEQKFNMANYYYTLKDTEELCRLESLEPSKKS